MHHFGQHFQGEVRIVVRGLVQAGREKRVDDSDAVQAGHPVVVLANLHVLQANGVDLLGARGRLLLEVVGLDEVLVVLGDQWVLTPEAG